MPPADPVVIDTNIALDLFVFQDAAAAPLRAALQSERLRWLATPGMRAELARVLGYPQIAKRLQQRALAADAVLAQWDALVQLLPAAPKADVSCKDPDDQPFIDLAVQQRALLLSKDAAVLCMKKRLLSRAVTVMFAIDK